MHVLLRGAVLSLVMAVAPASAQTALAQTWPERPVHFITSQAAGNATDIIARITADQLSARIGQPVVVENRPGGGNVIGTQAAARSAPDGYTLFLVTAAALVTDPYTFKSLPYDPMKDFVPVAKVAEVSFMIMANPKVPAKNLQELIALAKSQRGKLTIATDETDAVFKNPETLKKLREMGFSTSGAGTLKDAQDYVNLQHKAWGRVVREIGVQPE